MNDQIEKYIQENDMTNKEFARKTGVSVNLIYQWRYGVTPAKKWQAVLGELGIIVRKPWFERDSNRIAKIYRTHSAEEIAQILDRTPQDVAERLDEMENKKFTGEIGSYFFRNGFKTVLTRKLENGQGMFFDTASGTAFKAPLTIANVRSTVSKRRKINYYRLGYDREIVFYFRKTGVGNESIVKDLADYWETDILTVLDWARGEKRTL